MSNKYLNRKGFTIVEMAVAIGMVSILILVMGSQIVLAFKSMRSSDLASQLIQTEHELQMVLDDVYQCTSNLSGVNVPAVGGTTQLNLIKEYKGAYDDESVEWTYCAGENETCVLPVGGAAPFGYMIRYGTGGAYVRRTVAGDTGCNNAVFGDPAYGNHKTCEYAPAPAPLNSDEMKVRDIVRVDTPIQGLVSKRITLRTTSQISASEVIGQIEVQFDGTTQGTAPIVRRFPVYAVMSNGQLTQCAARSESSWLMSEHVCSIYQGGFYDQATNTCRYPEYRWVDGDERGASCLAGQSMSADANQWNSCESEAPPGFDDSAFPYPSRTYSDGSVSRDGPGPSTVQLDLATMTCRCLYAEGVDPTGWRCRARCLGTGTN